MGTRVLAVILAIGILVFIGIFVWTTVGTLDPRDTAAGKAGPTAEVSEQLSEGQLSVKVFALGNRDVRLEIQFVPNPDAGGSASMRPDVTISMVAMNMGSLSPPLGLVEAGIWRSNVQLPMAGRWIVSAGFGEEFAEVEFDAR